MSTYNVGNVEIALTSQMNEAVKAIRQLSAELNRISGVLNKTRVGVDNVGKSTRNVGNEAKRASKSISNMFTLGKLYFFINYTRRIAQGLGRIVQSAIDYRETINKFQVSMGDMYDRAVAFQNKMSEAYGLAKADLMDYQANFNNIIKGLGNVDVDVAYNMSETLTQMAVDFASLFNVSVDSAMTKFQSALTQQVRPIRSVSGFDITTPTLKTVMESIGITERSVSQLNQVEKRLLIIIALQRQMQNVGAMGDFARTIEQPANQLKILSQQLKETGIEIGNFALHWIAPAIKYVLGFVMAIKVLIQTLAGLAGYEQDDSVSAPLIEFEDSANSAAGAVGKTKKAVEDLKKATTGIDELNIIQQPKDTSGGGGAGGGVGGIDPRLLAELEKYDTVLDDVRMKAMDIRDKILDWLGVTDGTYSGLNKIKSILEVISAVIAAGGLMKLITRFSGEKFTHPVRALVGISLIIYAIIDGIKNINKLLDDDTTNDLDGIEGLLGDIGLAAAGIGVLIGAWPLAIAGAGLALITWIISKWDEIENWADTWADDVVDAVFEAKAAVNTFLAVIGYNIGTFFYNLGVSIYNFISQKITDIKNLGIGAINWLIGWLNKIPGVNIDLISGRYIPDLKETRGYATYAEGRAFYEQRHGYATGGFPTRGDYFLANENGVPEYVGSIGGRTAVANTNQIIQGISYGVSMAQSEQNQLLRQQNEYLRRILEKPNGVFMNGRDVANELDRVQVARGAKVIAGGY